jgi:hypothetical protein
MVCYLLVCSDAWYIKTNTNDKPNHKLSKFVYMNQVKSLLRHDMPKKEAEEEREEDTRIN